MSIRHWSLAFSSVAIVPFFFLFGATLARAEQGGIVIIRHFEVELRGKDLILPPGAWLPLEHNGESGWICQVGGCHFRVHSNLAVMTGEAKEFAQEQLRDNPMACAGFRALGHLHALEGQTKSALDHFDKVIALSPTPYAHDFLARGKIRADLGQLDAAMQDFHRAIEISRGAVHRPQALLVRGMAQLQKNRVAEALADWDWAASLSPRFAEPLRMKAWVLCTHPNQAIRSPDKAIQLALKAVEMLAHSPGECAALETLAAAHAEKGEYLLAIKALGKAFGAAGPRNKIQTAMLEEFTQRRPYRHDPSAAGPTEVTMAK